MYNPRLRANSGKQDGRYGNNRGGERGRQPISFRSCVEDSEDTDQKAAQVASAPQRPLCEVKTKLVDRNRAKVDQTPIRVVQSQDDPASQRREETGKLQEDRNKAVIGKAIAEATKAVEKTSVRSLRVIPPTSAKAATTRYPAECCKAD